MYGSNFPVDGVCGSYKDILAAVKVSVSSVFQQHQPQDTQAP